MVLTLNCRDLGAPCDHLVEGSSIDVVVASMQRHAVEVHGHDEAHVTSAEMFDAMRGAVKQSSRPAGLRTSRLDL